MRGLAGSAQEPSGAAKTMMVRSERIKMTKPTEKNPPFENALEQLEKIVEQVEQGRIGLEESIAQYEQGMKLIKYCRDILDQAEKHIRLIPDAAGICIDRLDWLRMYNEDRDDGLSWVSGRPALRSTPYPSLLLSCRLLPRLEK